MFIKEDILQRGSISTGQSGSYQRIHKLNGRKVTFAVASVVRKQGMNVSQAAKVFPRESRELLIVYHFFGICQAMPRCSLRAAL